MNRLTLLLLATGLSCAAAPAQQSTSTIVLVQYSPEGLVLNADLIQQLLLEPEADAVVKKSLGDDFQRIAMIDAKIAEGQPAGVCQIALTAAAQDRAWDVARRDAFVDTLVDHLRRRLDALLVEQPQARYQQQCHELQQRIGDLSELQRERTQQAAAYGARADQLQQQLQSVDQQALSIRVDLATEGKATEYLLKTRETLLEERAKLRTEFEAQQGERATIAALLDSASSKLADPKYPRGTSRTDELVDKLRAQVADLTQQLAHMDRSAAARQLPIDDLQRQLTLVLEQLPATALATQRASARLASLGSEREGIVKELEAVLQQARRIRADALGPDLEVLRAMLVEVQGRLARLCPVHCERLRVH